VVRVTDGQMTEQVVEKASSRCITPLYFCLMQLCVLHPFVC
jgi:hypothetical protein